MKIGVFICHCGLNIAGTLDVDALAEYAKNLPEVVHSETLKYACSEQGLDSIKKAVVEKGLDRVVIAACTPKLHEHTFRRALSEVGLNPYTLAIANIREQCSWVHTGPEANLKARDLIRMAVARARRLRPLEPYRKPVKRSVLVIGGGVAGITASLILSKFVDVYLVERSPTIGGNMALLNEVFPTNDCSICILAPRMGEVWRNERVKVFTNSDVVDVKGSAGDFKVRILRRPRFVDEEKCKGCIDICSDVCPVWIPEEGRKAIYLPIPQALPMCACVDVERCIGCMLCVEACPEKAVNFEQREEEITVDVGAIIVATGYRVRRKMDGRIITLMGLERLLSASGPTGGVLKVNGKIPKRIAFVLCSGSRDEKGKRYCSRVCCMATLKNAYTVKRRYPDVDVKVFYIDMRAYYEEMYRRVQETGVKFVRGKVSKVFEVDDGVVVRYENTLCGDVFEEKFDLVVLATPMEGDGGLSKVLGIHVDENGFYMPSHPKLRPAETNRRGIFLAGAASGPMDIRESVESAGLAASKALEIVMSDYLEFEPIHAYVNPDLCIGCRTCVKACDFNAIRFEGKRASVDTASCVGCGSCVASCPTGALNLNHFSEECVMAEIEALTVEKSSDPLILMFACQYCAYSALDLVGVMRVGYPANVRTIMVPCAGRVRPEWVLEALKRGVDAVVVAGCRLGECHYGRGNLRAERRFKALKEELGEEGWRLWTVWRSAGEVEIADDLKRIVEEVKRWREG